MSPAINENDLIVVNGFASLQSLQLGDIIVFNSPDGVSGIVTHRIVQFSQSDGEQFIVTKGDANNYSIPQVDYPITGKNLIGKVAFTIPSGGEFVSALRPPTAYIIIIGIVTTLGGGSIMLRGMKEKRQ